MFSLVSGLNKIHISFFHLFMIMPLRYDSSTESVSIQLEFFSYVHKFGERCKFRIVMLRATWLKHMSFGARATRWSKAIMSEPAHLCPSQSLLPCDISRGRKHLHRQKTQLCKRQAGEHDQQTVPKPHRTSRFGIHE